MGNSIENIIMAAVAWASGIEGAVITPDTTFEQLCIDSLDMIEMVIDVEEKLEIVTTDEEIAKLVTVADLVRLAEAKCTK